MKSQGLFWLAVPAVALLVAWSPADSEINQEDVCLACHDLDGALDAPIQHAPVVGGECSSCHNPHASKFDALLLDHPGALCMECHDDLRKAQDREVVHPPVAEGRCADCHEPHGGEHDGLLVRPSKELCRDCHGELTEWEERVVQHPPFALGSCSACHNPHASDHPGLSGAPGGKACITCHSADANFRRTHQGYPVENAACRQCHDPHASSQAGLFRDHLHAPFEAGECATCHVASDDAEPFGLVARQSELCGACHEEQVEESLTSAFAHVSAGGGRCTDCHNAHSGEGAALLHRRTRDLCLDCHDPGGAKSGEQGRFATHADLDCAECHAPHGASEPVMLKTDSVELCGQCHTHEHGIRHPVGEEHPDPRTAHPMTCLSCHSVHDAPYEMYLVASQEGDLCLGCHKDIGSGQ